MEQNRQPRNRPTKIYSTNFLQRHKSSAADERLLLQQTMFEQLDIHRRKQKPQPKSHSSHKNILKMDHGLKFKT